MMDEIPPDTGCREHYPTTAPECYSALNCPYPVCVMEIAPSEKRKKADSDAIREDWQNLMSVYQIAEKYGVSVRTVYRTVKGQR